MNQTADLSPSAAVRANWVLWFALFVGPLMFAGIASFLVMTSHKGGVLGGGEEAQSLSPDMIRTILAVVAATIVGGAFLVPSLMPVKLADGEHSIRALKEERDEARREELIDALVPRVMQAFRTQAIVGWAMAEGGALLAAINLLLTGMDVLPMAVLTVYAVFMLVTTPTTSRLTRAVEDLLADRGISVHEWERRLGAP